MIQDITNYLNNFLLTNTNQLEISFNLLFKGYIMRSCFSIDNSSKYEDYNKLLVVECIMLYRRYWEHRNNIVQDEEKQISRLKS